MTPFFYSVHTQWPLFFHFCIKFYIKIANFCTLRAHFEKFNNFVAILTEKLQNLPLEIAFLHTEWPPFLGAHTKKAPIFLVPTPNDPLFSTKSYTECPLFSFSSRHLYVTFILECPPGGENNEIDWFSVASIQKIYLYIKGTGHDFCWSENPIYHLQKWGIYYIYQNK